MKNFNYYVYRVMVELNKQISFDDAKYANMPLTIVRHEKFKEVYNILKNSKNKFAIKHYQKDYELFVNGEITEGILKCKLAKSKVITIRTENDKADDIEEHTIEDMPYVNIIVHLDSQALLIQKNTSVFTDTYSPNSIMESLLVRLMKEFNASVDVVSVKVEDSFWESYNALDSINILEIELISPNMFLASEKAEEVVQEFEDETNARSTTIKFKNKLGLRLKKHQNNNKEEGINKFITYANNGGGDWVIEGKKDGVPQKIKSSDKTKSIHLPEEITADKKVISKINKVVAVEESKDAKN